MSDDRYFPEDRDRYFGSDNCFIISGCGSAIVISVIKFDHSRACSLRYSPANLLSGSLYVQTYELTLRVALHARLHVQFVCVKAQNKTFYNLF